MLLLQCLGTFLVLLFWKFFTQPISMNERWDFIVSLFMLGQISNLITWLLFFYILPIIYTHIKM